MRWSLLFENINIAWRSLRSQLLRTILTICIIGFGIFALVGILTSLDALSQSVSSTLGDLGANSFTIRNRTNWGFNTQRKRYPPIRLFEAEAFKEQFSFPGAVSISSQVTNTGVVKYQNKKTHPRITIIGVDEQYLAASGLNLISGRTFNPSEAHDGAPLTIIGQDIYREFFSGKVAEDETIWLGKIRLRIVGVLEQKGSGGGISNDRQLLIPLNLVRRFIAGDNTSYTVTVSVTDPGLMSIASGEAEGLFRKVRRDKGTNENSFALEQSTGLLRQLDEIGGILRTGAFGIATIILLGALVGLLNIMLVSVTERTREIGVRKSMGATSHSIATQFLIEAVLICQLGGLLGIFLGITLGNLIAIFLGGTFIVPWNWIMVAVFVCVLVGVSSGLYPALKASRLNPVDALRYE